MNPIYKEVYQHFLLSDEDIIQIAEKHQKVEIEKGKIFLHEGETANEYYLLESGLIRAFVYDYDNNEITTEFFTKGDIVIVPASLFSKDSFTGKSSGCYRLYITENRIRRFSTYLSYYSRI